MMQDIVPYLNGSIKGGTGKGISIFGIEVHLHNEMGMPFEHLSTLVRKITARQSILSIPPYHNVPPSFVPIPQFYQHII